MNQSIHSNRSKIESNSAMSEISNGSIDEINLNQILNKSTNNPGLNTFGKIAEYDDDFIDETNKKDFLNKTNLPNLSVDKSNSTIEMNIDKNYEKFKYFNMKPAEFSFRNNFSQKKMNLTEIENRKNISSFSLNNKNTKNFSNRSHENYNAGTNKFNYDKCKILFPIRNDLKENQVNNNTLYHRRHFSFSIRNNNVSHLDENSSENISNTSDICKSKVGVGILSDSLSSNTNGVLEKDLDSLESLLNASPKLDLSIDINQIGISSYFKPKINRNDVTGGDLVTSASTNCKVSFGSDLNLCFFLKKKLINYQNQSNKEDYLFKKNAEITNQVLNVLIEKKKNYLFKLRMYNKKSLATACRINIIKEDKIIINSNPLNNRNRKENFIRQTLGLISRRDNNSEQSSPQKMRTTKSGVFDFNLKNFYDKKCEVKKILNGKSKERPSSKNIIQSQRIIYASKIIQKWWREILNAYINLNLKIIRIQSYFRGYCTRSFVYDLFYSKFLIQILIDSINLSFNKKLSNLLKCSKRREKNDSNEPEYLIKSRKGAKKLNSISTKLEDKRIIKFFKIWYYFTFYFNNNKIKYPLQIEKVFSSKLILKFKKYIDKKKITKRFIYWKGKNHSINNNLDHTLIDKYMKFIKIIQKIILKQILKASKKFKHKRIEVVRENNNDVSGKILCRSGRKIEKKFVNIKDYLFRWNKKVLIIKLKENSNLLKSKVSYNLSKILFKFILKNYFKKWKFSKDKILLKIVKKRINKENYNNEHVKEKFFNKWKYNTINNNILMKNLLRNIEIKICSKIKKYYWIIWKDCTEEILKLRKKNSLRILRIIYSKYLIELKKKGFDGYRTNTRNKNNLEKVIEVLFKLICQNFKISGYSAVKENCRNSKRKIEKIKRGLIIMKFLLKNRISNRFKEIQIKIVKFILFKKMRTKIIKGLFNYLDSKQAKVMKIFYLKWKIKCDRNIPTTENFIYKLENFLKLKIMERNFDKLKGYFMLGDSNESKRIKKFVINLTNKQNIKLEFYFLIWKNNQYNSLISNSANKIQSFFIYASYKRRKVYPNTSFRSVYQGFNFICNKYIKFYMGYISKKIKQEGNRRTLIKFILYLRNMELKNFNYSFNRIKEFEEVKTLVINGCAKKLQDRFRLLKYRVRWILLIKRIRKMKDIMEIVLNKDKRSLASLFKKWYRRIKQHKIEESSIILQNFIKKKINLKKLNKLAEVKQIFKKLFVDNLILKQLKPFVKDLIKSIKFNKAIIKLRKCFLRVFTFKSKFFCKSNCYIKLLSSLSRFNLKNLKICRDRVVQYGNAVKENQEAIEIQRSLKKKKETKQIKKIENIFSNLKEKNCMMMNSNLRKWQRNSNNLKLNIAAGTMLKFVSDKWQKIKASKNWLKLKNKLKKINILITTASTLIKMALVKRFSKAISIYKGKNLIHTFKKFKSYLKISNINKRITSIMNFYKKKQNKLDLSNKIKKWNKCYLALRKRDIYLNNMHRLLKKKQSIYSFTISLFALKVNHLSKILLKKIKIFSLKRIKRRAANNRNIKDLSAYLNCIDLFYKTNSYLVVADKIYVLYIYKIYLKLFDKLYSKKKKEVQKYFIYRLNKNRKEMSKFSSSYTINSRIRPNLKNLYFKRNDISRKTVCIMQSKTKDKNIYSTPFLFKTINNMLKDRLKLGFSKFKHIRKADKLFKSLLRGFKKNLSSLTVFKKIFDYAIYKFEKSKCMYSLKKIFRKSLLSYIKDHLEHVSRITKKMRLIKLIFMHKKMVANIYLQSLIRGWRFTGLMKKLTKTKLGKLFKNMQTSYLSAAEEIFKIESENTESLFERSDNSKINTKFENTNLIEKVREKYNLNRNTKNNTKVVRYKKGDY